jgi:hypothetical protein
MQAESLSKADIARVHISGSNFERCGHAGRGESENLEVASTGCRKAHQLMANFLPFVVEENETAHSCACGRN